MASNFNSTGWKPKPGTPMVPINSIPGSVNEFKSIPNIPLAESKFVADSPFADKANHAGHDGLFTVDYLKSRSTWARGNGPKVIYSKNAVGKLSELGFDPIETMVRKFDEIQSIIDNVLMSAKPSMIAVTQLLGLQQKISNDLMKYGYNQVAERSPEEGVHEAPIRIILTVDESPSVNN